MQGFVLPLAAAVAGLAAAVVAEKQSTVSPLYLVKAPFSPYESPPFSPSAQVGELSHSSLPGLLAHAAGATKNVAALDIQQWANNDVFPTSFGAAGSSSHAVAAIELLGVKVDITQQILPMVMPAFIVKDAPSSTGEVVDMMENIESIFESSNAQLKSAKKTVSSTTVIVAFNDESAAAAMPSPRRASEVIGSFNSRLSSLGAPMFDADNEVDAAFISEIEYISDVFTFLSERRPAQFTGVVTGALQGIANAYGITSEKYDTACLVVKELLIYTVIPKFLHSAGSGATIAVLMSTPATKLHKRSFENLGHVLHKRQVTLPPTNGTSAAAVVECPKDQATCESQTNKCNSRGQCIKNKLGCFRCQCTKAVDPNSVSKVPVEWAGDACDYHYAAPQFFLLWGTGIAFLLAVLAISVLVVTMGGAMDSGPMAGASAGGLKTD